MVKVPLEHMPVTALKGVGDKLAAVLDKLGIASLQDLLFHLPYRYVDRTQITAIDRLSPNNAAVIQGEVLHTTIAMGRRRSLAVTVGDQSGQICLRYYHYTAALKQQFDNCGALRCFGEARLGATGLEMYHPECEFLQSLDDHGSLNETLTPIYSLTEGITQPRLRKLIEQALITMQTAPPKELLPAELTAPFGTLTLDAALSFAHNPPKDTDIHSLLAGTHPCLRRLAFEELIAHNLAVQKSRQRTKKTTAPALSGDAGLKQSLLKTLPFELTRAQQHVIQEIEKDMAQKNPMLRLVQGDVGSGKTLVAAFSALIALANNYQVALVAPTEILAEQHLANFSQWLKPLNIEVGWLVGRLTAAQKRKTKEALQNGTLKMIIGTHALFEESVVFNKIGLAVIDEQHRFGVHQRLTLRNKGEDTYPHQLIMTATPIPRTLAMSVYADLDISVIDELPPGRKPITTSVISQARKDDIIARVLTACDQGQQAYWVCTLIEDSETLSAAAAEETAKALQQAMPTLSIGLVHGRMKPTEKEAVMARFKGGELQLLVATTVIEVGVDVPNASLMIIENPERLGLAQLHQLRGRVGRGNIASHCVLLYGSPLSQHGRSRLQALRESSDGFVIAEKDLELRGPGELLGTQQTGQIQFRIADLLRDQELIEQVQKSARVLLKNQPELCEHIIARWYAREQDYVNV